MKEKAFGTKFPRNFSFDKKGIMSSRHDSYVLYIVPILIADDCGSIKMCKCNRTHSIKLGIIR